MIPETLSFLIGYHSYARAGLTRREGKVVANPDRILERLRREPSEITFADIQTLLSALGWTVEPGKSSHIMLVSPRKSTITIATVKGRTIKRTYLRLILKEIERGAGM